MSNTTTQFVPLTIGGKVAIVPITQGKRCLIDAADWPLVGHLKWIHWGRYAARANPDGTRTIMHRVLAETPPGMQTDHINRNKLDNRRSNLRNCSASQNQANRVCRAKSSGFMGVTWDKSRNLWKAHIEHGRHHKNLGHYPTAEEAARVRDRAAVFIYGEFASINFPELNPVGEMPVLPKRFEIRKFKPCPHCGRIFAIPGQALHVRKCVEGKTIFKDRRKYKAVTP